MQRFEFFSLETDSAAAVVIPALGGRILELTDKRSGRQWLWRNHQVGLGASFLGQEYDARWQGGFEELFPNDAPTSQYPDHGELWTQEWQVTAATACSVTLEAVGPISGVRVRKRLELADSTLSLEYELQNDGPALSYLFKLHPAISIHEDCEILMDGGTVEQVEPGFGTICREADGFPWPGGWPTDLSKCRGAGSGDREFVYVKDMTTGRCGVTDHRARSRILFEYPIESFPYCWLFITYGGWNDHSVVVLEPCTNYPKDLDMAVAAGTSARLERESSSSFWVNVHLESL